MKSLRTVLLLVVSVFVVTTFSCKKESPFILLSPANNSTNIPITQTLTWSPVNNVKGYILYINGPGAIGFAFPSVCSTTVTLRPNSKYLWHVQAVMLDNTVLNTGTDSFSTVAALALLQPSGDNTCLTPTFTWIAQPGVNNYDLVITDFNSGDIITTVQVTGTSYTLPAGLLSSFKYYRWKVAPTGTTDFTDPGEFKTAYWPTLISPAAGATVSATNITLMWSSFPCATSYLLEVSPYSDFRYLQLSQTVTDTVYTTSVLQGHTFYYCRARVTGDTTSSSIPGSTFYTQ